MDRTVYACCSVYHQVLTETQAIQRSPVSGGYDGAQGQRDAQARAC